MHQHISNGSRRGLQRVCIIQFVSLYSRERERETPPPLTSVTVRIQRQLLKGSKSWWWLNQAGIQSTEPQLLKLLSLGACGHCCLRSADIYSAYVSVWEWPEVNGFALMLSSQEVGQKCAQRVRNCRAATVSIIYVCLDSLLLNQMFSDLNHTI